MAPIDYSGFPDPKPIRKPKERKPLVRRKPLRKSAQRAEKKRTIPAERMRFMTGYAAAIDPADFRIGNWIAVYGPTPLCIHTAKSSLQGEPVDPHHILGRGKKGQWDIMSSIFNLAWLRRDIHTGPLRDAPDQRAVYLRVACQHVMNAAGQGKYTMNDIDRAFIAFIRREHPEYADIYEGIPID